MTVFRYRCKGGYRLCELRKYGPLQQSNMKPRPQHQVGRQFVDEPRYRAVPIWQRPKARALNGVLRTGDELHISLAEFSGCAPDIVSYYRRTARVLRGWHRRGVKVRLSEFPVEMTDMAGLTATFDCLADSEAVWVREAAAEQSLTTVAHDCNQA